MTSKKVALVTGSGTGCGIAKRLAESECHVILVDKSAQENAAACAEIINSGGCASAFTADIRDVQEVKSLFQDVSKVDLLVNNAGLQHVKPVEEFDENVKTPLVEKQIGDQAKANLYRSLSMVDGLFVNPNLCRDDMP